VDTQGVPEVQAAEVQAPTVGERFEIRIGSDVYCRDVLCGRVEKVVFNPRQRRITHLVIGRGLLAHQDRVVPIEQVERAGDEGVWLSLSSEELEASRRYDPAEFTAAYGDIPGISHEHLLLALPLWSGLRRHRREPSGAAEAVGGSTTAERPTVVAGTPVYGRDGPIGHVAAVLVHPDTAAATHLVVRAGRLLARDVIVPVDWATEITPERITLDVERRQIEQLPEYRPDPEIAADVLAALERHPQLRVASLPGITVRVHDGIVYLEGNVATQSHRRLAEEIAASVRGVLEVRNELYADDAVQVQIAQALARDLRTRGLIIHVDVRRGVVELQGTVQSEEERHAAMDVALMQPGVRTVVSLLETAAEREAHQRAMDIQPGAEVRLTDGALGHVEYVIVSPRERRVTHLIVRGPWDDDRSLRVVPVEYVYQVEPGYVSLRLNLREFLDMPVYDPLQYIAPGVALAAGGRQPEAVRLAAPGTAQSVAVAAAPARAVPGAASTEQIVLQRGIPVTCPEGEVGRVDHVLADRTTGEATHIVVRGGGRLEHTVAIPVEWAEEITPREVRLAVGFAALNRLPPHQEHISDHDVQIDLESRLLWYRPAGGRPAALEVRVENGVVTLHGVVPTERDRIAAERIARDTPGVWEVVNHLVSDEQIERAVGEALRTDAATAPYAEKITYSSLAGHVALILPAEADQAAVERVVRAVPGVRGVTLYPGAQAPAPTAA
jgi:osmotically-inducible protein OsmY